MKLDKLINDIMGDVEESNTKTEKSFELTTSNSDWQPQWHKTEEPMRRNHTKSFKNKEELWAAACKYFDHVQNNPIIKKEFIKTGPYAGQQVEVEAPRPFSWSGLNVFLTTNGITTSMYRYRYNDGDAYADYQDVIKLIDDVMFTQKFEGAVVGIFKENIISREIGLAEKTNNNLTIDQPLFEL